MRFTDLIARIRAEEPQAAFRSSFIVGFPGETEDQHDELLAFLRAVQLDWAGFFAFSREDGTPAAHARRSDSSELHGRAVTVNAASCRTRSRRAAGDVGRRGDRGRHRRCGSRHGTLVGRTYREAPEIDGIVRISGATFARPGAAITALVTVAEGTDLDRDGSRLGHRSAGVVSGPVTEWCATKRFGPGAVATPANFITIGRLLLAIPTLILIYEEGASWLTVSLWFVLSCTDGVDGWVARRRRHDALGRAPRSPLADKFLTIGGFVAPLDARRHLVVPVVDRGARSVVSIYRSAAARRGSPCRPASLGSGRRCSRCSRWARTCCRPVAGDERVQARAPLGRGRVHHHLGDRHRPPGLAGGREGGLTSSVIGTGFCQCDRRYELLVDPVSSLPQSASTRWSTARSGRQPEPDGRRHARDAR